MEEGSEFESNHIVSLKSLDLQTPAFVYDESSLLRLLQLTNECVGGTFCKVLYSLKACSFYGMLELIASNVHGFACSSLFEARLGREALGNQGTLHITTPGLRPDEISAISELCDFVTFNSLSQWARFKAQVGPAVQCGIRLDPRLSFVRDERYDPCRKYSKLGVPMEHLIEILDSVPTRLDEIRGLHFHTNCDSTDFRELFATVRHIEARLRPFLERINWINLGGGYLIDEASNVDAFHDAVELLHNRYGLEVFIEPGATIVRKAGYLVSTVLDLFSSDGRTIAVLDATVNHMPEVFEYQFEPDVMGHVDKGRYSYMLTGSTCLSGDMFGEYSFDEPLEIGTRLIFTHSGSYTLVKAHSFNGINLPSIYAFKPNGALELKRRFTYEDFASRCGVDKHACI